ncbi:MAG: recombinase A, partial [Planctomycetes bacterium]|nr:recombinase A [Planctomycetota bacterium]
VTGVLLEAQLRGEPVAWVATGATTFFPPDLAASGIDLAALPVIQVEKGLPVLRAADALLRSGSFGVVVLDLGEQVSMTLAVQTRLVGLARRFATALIALTRSRNHPQRTRGPRSQSRANSLGSLVSLRAACTHRRTDFDRFTCELHALKDKRRGPGWRHTEVCRGPNGLC